MRLDRFHGSRSGRESYAGMPVDPPRLMVIPEDWDPYFCPFLPLRTRIIGATWRCHHGPARNKVTRAGARPVWPLGAISLN